MARGGSRIGVFGAVGKRSNRYANRWFKLTNRKRICLPLGNIVVTNFNRGHHPGTEMSTTRQSSEIKLTANLWEEYLIQYNRHSGNIRRDIASRSRDVKQIEMYSVLSIRKERKWKWYYQHTFISYLWRKNVLIYDVKISYLKCSFV